MSEQQPGQSAVAVPHEPYLRILRADLAREQSQRQMWQALAEDQADMIQRYRDTFGDLPDGDGGVPPEPTVAPIRHPAARDGEPLS